MNKVKVLYPAQSGLQKKKLLVHCIVANPPFGGTVDQSTNSKLFTYNCLNTNSHLNYPGPANRYPIAL